MSAPNRREYPVSSVVIEDLLSEAQIEIDEINARIGNGEKVTAAAQVQIYARAFSRLQVGLQSAICTSIASGILPFALDDDVVHVDVAREFPL